MDNLRAAGTAAPMLAVMERGYATRPGKNPPRVGSTAPTTFDEVVVRNLIPAIDARYRTPGDRDHRATAGLSMGINQLSCPESECRHFQNNGIFRKPELLNSKLKLLWVGSGTAELYYQYPKASPRYWALGVKAHRPRQARAR